MGFVKLLSNVRHPSFVRVMVAADDAVGGHAAVQRLDDVVARNRRSEASAVGLPNGLNSC